MRVEVRPRWHFRLPTVVGLDRLMRRHGSVLHRLVHFEEQPVVVRVAQTSADAVLFGAAAPTRAAAEHGIARMRAALGVDQDLRAFHERFRHDPLIGAAVRADPGLRLAARPDPFEALTWAVCEQLIEYERAAAIQRRLSARLGRRCQRHRAPRRADRGARSPPARPPSSPPLTSRRAARVALIRCAREVASGRVDLLAPDPEPGWRRLRAIPGIGAWTIQTLACSGQGRVDQLPAGDLAYIKLVGRLLTGDALRRGRPRRRSRRSLRRTHPGPRWPVRTRCAAARAGRRCGSPPEPLRLPGVVGPEWSYSTT